MTPPRAPGSDRGRPAAAPPPALRLTGGIVAFNEERGIGRAIDSLLGQRLPEGIVWDRVWVVASGCEDRTEEVARTAAARDPRLGLVVEPDRGGKARALGQVFRRAEGDLVVLLNADAEAAPDAVARMVAAARGHPPPFAVMARPVVPGVAESPWDRSVRLMWAIHDELHRELLGAGTGTHVADELLLVSRPGVPPLPEGIINDGSYLGAAIRRCGGSLLYAPEARVAIDVPRSLGDHLVQRRRIHVGHLQVRELLGVPPTTISRFARRDPLRAIRLLRRTVPPGLSGAASLAGLAGAEALAAMLSLWDRGPLGRADPVRWQRIGARAPPPRRSGPADVRTDPRRTAADPDG